MKPRRLGYILVAILAGGLTASAWAEQQAGNDQNQDLLNEYMQTSKVVDGLKVYNSQLQKQMEDQQKLMDQLNNSIDSAEDVRRQLVPLLHQMVESLQQFVNLDLPFDLKARQGRIDDLKAAMDRPDLSIAEKFKKVMAAYEKELDYGTSYEVYSEFIKINGRPREVDVLRWGRLVLAFQTPDQEVDGVWDNQTRQWKVLDSRFHSGIRKAFRVARGITSKSFVILPVPAATVESGPETAQN